MPPTQVPAPSTATGRATTEATVAPARPFREGLMVLAPPRLLGSRCEACDTAVFPAREFCPACRAVDTPTGIELSPEGRVHSFTVVRQAPPGVAVPYVLAWIDLPADRVRLMATVVGIAPEQVELDLPVVLELAPCGAASDGAPLLGYRFRAAAGVAT